MRDMGDVPEVQEESRPEKFKFTSAFIHEALERRFCPPRWIYTKEFDPLPGYEWHKGRQFNDSRFLDSLAFNLWPAGDDGHVLMAFEIKVSRADFRAEIKNPKKRQQALHLADEFYFVTPKGMISKDEIPHEAGLFEVKEDGSVRIALRPPKPAWNAPKRPDALSRGLMAAILRKNVQRNVESHAVANHRMLQYKVRNIRERVQGIKARVRDAQRDMRIV
jgi:hypothetical protein